VEAETPPAWATSPAAPVREPDRHQLHDAEHRHLAAAMDLLCTSSGPSARRDACGPSRHIRRRASLSSRSRRALRATWLARVETRSYRLLAAPTLILASLCRASFLRPCPSPRRIEQRTAPGLSPMREVATMSWHEAFFLSSARRKAPGRARAGTSSRRARLFGDRRGCACMGMHRDGPSAPAAMHEAAAP